jgi:hypothetical protein
VQSELEKSFSQDFEVMTVLTAEPRLCTLHELETIYSVEHLYDFLEIIEAKSAVEEDFHKREQVKQQQQAQARK